MEDAQYVIDLLIKAAAQDAKRHIEQQKFLENQIKILIGAIRTAPDVASLGVIANVTIQRIQERAKFLWMKISRFWDSMTRGGQVAHPLARPYDGCTLMQSCARQGFRPKS